jgi:aquaporin Z
MVCNVFDRNATNQQMIRALREHWPEYLLEAAELEIFMISAGIFTSFFEYPGSPIRQAIGDDFLRRALIGMAMELESK